MIVLFQQLLNSGSKAMNVDGSSVSKTFTYSPGGSVDVHLNGISVVLRDEGTATLAKFGSITALTNGILIQATQSGVTRTIATVKDNGDLITYCTRSHFGSSAVLSLLGIATPEGFGNSNNIFVGFIEFGDVMLTGSDSVSVIIQDNLSGVDTLQMTARIETD